MKSMENRKPAWLAVVLPAAVLTHAHGDIQPGARFDQVTQELGNDYSSTRIGNTDVLSYKNGISVRIENGVVTEITQRGQIGVTRVIQRAMDEREIRQIMGPAPRRVAANEALKPADPMPVTPVTARSPATPKPPTKGGPSPGVAAATKNAASQQQPPNIPQALGKPGTLLARIQQTAMGLILLLYAIALLAYLFSCYCYKRICQKADQTPGALIWIPVAQFVPLLRVAQLPAWTLILLLIPVVNVVAMLILWARICAALKKSPWLAASLLVPVVNFILIPYLAFSKADRAED